MTCYSASGPRLCGIVTALPPKVVENRDLSGAFGPDIMAKIIATTGIERRPVADRHTVSELGAVAARRLLERLDWAPASIGLLVVVTQTPDYPLPSTAALMQAALGLGTGTIAFDVGLGCSGYVYGLSVATAMMQSAGIQRALLVTGDMTTRMVSHGNRTLEPLFGDAVAVTALERSEDGRIAFDLGTDGTGAPYLISKTGGLAEPGTPELFMDGTQVMAFSLKQVAPSILRALEASGRPIADIDRVVLHQANAMMMKTLGHKIKASDDQMVYAIRDYGNTSSASIPLALCDYFGKRPFTDDVALLLCGFGVGWSWATAVWHTPAPQVYEIVRVAE